MQVRVLSIDIANVVHIEREVNSFTRGKNVMGIQFIPAQNKVLVIIIYNEG